MSTNELAPITNKVWRETFIGGPGSGRTRRECWSAETADGVWLIERIDAPGTPWTIVHVKTGTPVALCGSLRKARWHIGAGFAATRLAEHLAKSA